MRILEGRAAESYVRKLEQRGQKLDALEPQVRRIVESVRRDGDRALRRYAEKWDGLSASRTVARFGRRNESRAEGFIAGAADGAADRSRKYPEFLRMAKTRGVGASKAGAKIRAIDTAAQFSRMLRARRTLSPALDIADDRDSSPGGGSEGYSSGLASPGPGDAGGGRAVGSA